MHFPKTRAVFVIEAAVRLKMTDLCLEPELSSHDLPLQGGVPVVFYVVVSSAREKGGNFGPLVAMNLMLLSQHYVLFQRPLTLLYGRVQMVVPPSSTGGIESRGKLCRVLTE